MSRKANIVFHSADLDGHCSGVVCYMGLLAMGYMPDDITMIPWNYGQPVPECKQGEDYVLTDISFPLDDMLLYQLHARELVWIDHHKSAIEEMRQLGKIPGLQRVGDSASLLAWEFYFTGQPLPEAVYWVDRYDVWKKDNPVNPWDMVLDAQFGLRYHTSIPTDEKSLEHWESIIRKDDAVFYIRQDGKLLYDYEAKQNKIHCSRAFDLTFHGLKFAAINNPMSGSLVLESYKRDYHDALMVFGYDPKINAWRVSLYENGKDIDLTVIAKEYGGGGHRNACGFQVDDINEVISPETEWEGIIVGFIESSETELVVCCQDWKKARFKNMEDMKRLLMIYAESFRLSYDDRYCSERNPDSNKVFISKER